MSEPGWEVLGTTPDVTPSRPDSSIPADLYTAEPGEEEPAWVQTEREQFRDFRDLNKDGKLDKDEIRHWILPQDYDHAQAEARHLVYESDKNKVFRSVLEPFLEGRQLT